MVLCHKPRRLQVTAQDPSGGTHEYYFRKRLDWRDEVEVRLVALPSTQIDFAYLDISRTLTGICVGHHFPDVYRPSLAATCLRLGVPAYKLVYGFGVWITQYIDPTGAPTASITGAG